MTMPSVHTPASALDIATPAESGDARQDELKAASALQSLASNLVGPDETLHCVGVSQMCMKVGRITVPPTVAFATQGLCIAKDSEQWREVQRIRKSGGMLKFLSGGWKDVPESERWWNDAYAPLEATRLRNLAACDAIKTAMEQAQSF